MPAALAACMALNPHAVVAEDGTTEPVDVLSGYTVGIVDAGGSQEFVTSLRGYGADVLQANVEDVLPTRRVLDGLVATSIDALVVLDVSAASALLSATHRARSGGELRAVLRGGVLVGCLDAEVAAPLVTAGIPATVAQSPRPEAIAALVVEQVPLRRGKQCVAAGHALDVRSQGVVVDGSLQRLPATAMALLRALAQQPGHVVSREKLLALLPGEKVSGHAVDVAIGRLRTALGDPAIIATVVKRGYRLAVA